MGAVAVTLTDEVRAFNRFYTREIGLLNRSLPATDLSLPEARVLYELAQAPEGGEPQPRSAGRSTWTRRI